MTEAAVGRTDLPPGAAPTAALEDAGVEPRERRLDTFRSLRYRDYRLLWIGTLFDSSGQWIQNTTVPWLVYNLTGSPFLLGAINASRALPLLVLGPLGGVIADRSDRKWLMLWTQVMLFVTALTMSIIIVTGHLQVWELFVFMGISGVAWAFNNPVRQSVVPNLVPKESLMNALALNSAGFNFTRIVGPAVGGLMLATVGAGENFMIQAVAYLGVASMVVQMRIPPVQRANTVSVRENLVDGARYVWGEPRLRMFMMLALVPMVMGMPYQTLFPVFAKKVLHQGEIGFGLELAATGVGAVLGTLTIATMGTVRRKGLMVLGAIFAMGIAILMFSQSRSFPLSLGLLVISGAAQMVYITTNQTILQLMIPDHLRGRVMGIYMLNMGLMPLGALFAGSVASAFGAPTAAAIMGGSVASLALFIGIKSPSVRAA
jgi:MFS family permease